MVLQGIYPVQDALQGDKIIKRFCDEPRVLPGDQSITNKAYHLLKRNSVCFKGKKIGCVLKQHLWRENDRLSIVRQDGNFLCKK